MSAEGKWTYTLNTEFGVMDGSLELSEADGNLRGTFVNMGSRYEISQGHADGKSLTFSSTLRTQNAVLMLKVEATFEGDCMQGMFRTSLGDSPFTATRAT